MHARYLSETQVRSLKKCSQNVNLAMEGMEMEIIGEISLDYSIQGQTMTSSFLVSNAMRDPMILGIPWSEDQEAIYNHPLRCIYAGKSKRLLIYLIDQQSSGISGNLDLSQLETDLPSEFRPPFEQLLQRHHRAFYKEGHLTQTRSISHKINLTTTKPVRKKPYSYSQDKKKVIQDQIKDMLHQQVIEPCMSPYCSPIVLTKRKNGEPRFCIDFRGLNAITRDVTQALPLIPDVIKEFGDSVVFTTLDLKNGY